MYKPIHLCTYVVQLCRKTVLLFLIIGFFSCGSNDLLEEVVEFPSYPSASGIEYRDKKIYIIGDDATHLLVLDSNMAYPDSIMLYPGNDKKIPKAVKPDLEAAAFTNDDRLLLLGSGSASPQRNIGWLIDPNNKKADSIRLDTFYSRLQMNGIKELNIEGATSIPGSLLLSARGSKGYRRNHLIITEKNFWQNQSQATITTILAGSNTDSSVFNGISGLAYASKSDRLLLTVSTEDTQNSLDDGAIGKSYIWMIKNISSKKRWKAINPDKIIDLESIDPRFKGQKIESASVLKETNNFLHLMLAADNDNGNSSLFRVIIQKD
jgi:hypothetical protein